YKLRASTDDSAEVNMVLDGNFYFTSAEQEVFYISDYKLIFNEDLSLETPYGFTENTFDQLKKISQVHVNQVPCAMSGFKFKNFKEAKFISVIGYSKDKDSLSSLVKRMNLNYLLAKENENRTIHD